MSLHPGQIPDRLRDILVGDEEVLWIGKPSVWASAFSTGMVLLNLTAVMVFQSSQGFWRPEGQVKPMMLVGLIGGLVAFLILKIWYEGVCRRHAIYGFTNRRVVLPAGWNHAKLQSLDYGDIKDVILHVSPIGTRAGLGSIQLRSSRRALGSLFPSRHLVGIEKPETVFRVLRRTWLIAKGELPQSAMEWEPRV